MGCQAGMSVPAVRTEAWPKFFSRNGCNSKSREGGNKAIAKPIAIDEKALSINVAVFAYHHMDWESLLVFCMLFSCSTSHKSKRIPHPTKRSGHQRNSSFFKPFDGLYVQHTSHEPMNMVSKNPSVLPTIYILAYLGFGIAQVFSSS